MTGISWYRTPIEKETLKTLTARSDLKGFLQACSFLVLYAGLAFLGVWFFLNKQWGLMAAACVVHSIFLDFVGMEAAVHELSHGTPFKTKWLNELFYRIFSFLTWNNYLHFRISHMKHHQFTAFQGLDKEVIIERDPYTFPDYLGWFTFDFKKFKMIMFSNIAHFFGNGDADFFSWDPLLPEGDENRKKMINWARFMVIGHLVLLAVFIYFQLWVLIFLVTFGYFFFTFVSKGTGIIQHHGLCPNVPDWRVVCHTVKTGPVISYLYWRMQYHIEHHMYAAVPFHNLRKLHKIIAFDTPKPPGSFFAGLTRIRKIHRQQRTDPDYCFVADFPETAAPPKLSKKE